MYVTEAIPINKKHVIGVIGAYIVQNKKTGSASAGSSLLTAKTGNQSSITNIAQGPSNINGETGKDPLVAQGPMTDSEYEDAIETSDVRTRYSLREEDPPKHTKIGYKAFFVKDGKLYPPMVANPSGAGTPVGVWLNADTGKLARDKEGNLITTQGGRMKVGAGGKGTKGGSGTLAWRPGWHLGPYPDATQFWKKGADGKQYLNPDIVFCEVEFAADVDYQMTAYEYGVKENGGFDHSQAGIPFLIKDGYYRYRTNTMKEGTSPWYISGAMKVNKVLTDAECRDLCRKLAGVEMFGRENGDFDFEAHGLKPGPVTPTTDLASISPAMDESELVANLPGYVRREINWDDSELNRAFTLDFYDDP